MRIKSGVGSQLRQKHQGLCKRIKPGVRVVYRSPKETFRHLPLFCREAPFSSPLRKLYLLGRCIPDLPSRVVLLLLNQGLLHCLPCSYLAVMGKERFIVKTQLKGPRRFVAGYLHHQPFYETHVLHLVNPGQTPRLVQTYFGDLGVDFVCNLVYDLLCG